MNFVLDTHTHTVASGHAYSTLTEMIVSAKQKHLELLSITEHGVQMPGTCHNYYFHNYRVIRRNIDGLTLLMGCEANIIDYNGQIDMEGQDIDCLDLVIASLHLPCLKPGTMEQNTNAFIGAMKNPRVSIIGHPDDGRYPVDYLRLVKAAKEHHVLLELNNGSLNPAGFRINAKVNDITMLNLCKQYNVSISLGSDAHIADDICNFCYAQEVLKETNFPEKLIVNNSVEKFKKFIK